jgi:hypothetical protein
MDLERLQNFFSVLSGFLTPVIAVIVAWIAYQQMKINKYKIRIDLFEKRMQIFSVIRESLSKIFTDGSPQKVNWNDFYFAIEQSKFLLNNELQLYLNEIESKMRQMRATEMLLYGSDGKGGLPVGEQRNKVCDENSELLKWLIDQNEPLQKKFADFMKMNKI